MTRRIRFNPEADFASRVLHGGANVTMLTIDGPTCRIDIDEVPGSEAWRVSLYFAVELAGLAQYVLSFTARADGRRPVAIGLGENFHPWSNLDLYERVELTTEWSEFRFRFRFRFRFPLPAIPESARIHLDLANTTTPLELAGVAFAATSAS